MKKWFLLSLMVVFVMLLNACAPAAPVAKTAPSGQAATEASKPTEVASVATEAASVPAQLAAGAEIGGKLIVAVAEEPPTLDATLSSWSDLPLWLIGGSLIYIDARGEYVPYLAESWQASEDGLTWDFKLRKDVKFHNGQPLTARDYAWTYQRALDEEVASPATGPSLGDVKSIEAVDDHTLRIVLNVPNYPLLYSLAEPGFMQPLPQEVVKKEGDKFGHNPVGVGPYKLKEWVSGDHITLERNPDFAWAPKPWADKKIVNYFETIEIRVIPEYSTALAGLESGDIDYTGLQSKDVEMIKGLGKFEVFGALTAGTAPALFLNVTKAPFDNLKVRQAFNHVVDRDPIIKMVANGNAEPQKGPLSSSVLGYSKEIEALGYATDVEKAKTLMKEAGYTAGSDGILVGKDGKPLKLKLNITSSSQSVTKLAEILKEQYKQIGVELEIQQQDESAMRDMLANGDYEIAITGQQWGEADTMYYMFHSSMIGGYNWSQINDPELDKLLDLTRNETDPAKRQKAVDDTCKMVIDKAVIVPLYAETQFFAMNNRIKGATYSPFTFLNLWEATLAK